MAFFKVLESPVSPRKKLNLILALLVGILGDVGLCFFMEYPDNTVKGPEEVERLAGLPSLGKPVLLLREMTERAEAVEAGTVRVVGTERERIVEEASQSS